MNQSNKMCNRCGINEKYPRQGLCKKCLSEKQTKKHLKKRIYKEVRNLTGEVWVEIENAKGYFVSNMGRIKTNNYHCRLTGEIKNEKLLKLREARKGGYLKIDLDKYNWRPSVHRLVATYFVKNEDKSKNNIVNHIDFNKQNNKATNLEWCDHSKNGIHAFKLLKNKHTFYDHVKKVWQINLITGERIKRYDMIAEAGRQLNISSSNIVQVAKGRKKSAGGYGWEYD